MAEFDYSLFQETAENALVNSSIYVRDIFLKDGLYSETKSEDGSLLTEADEKSQKIGGKTIKALSEYHIWQEEKGGLKGSQDSPIYIFHDPIDGTRPFADGAGTSTIILGAYDSQDKKILAVAVMDPMLGRFWYASQGEGTYFNCFDYQKKNWKNKEWKDLHVDFQPFEKSGILIDCSHAFKRSLEGNNSKEIISQKGRRNLTTQIENISAAERGYGSNGIHYALLCQGRDIAGGVGGVITTAKGGPFDIAPLILITEAGGFASCYMIDNNRKLQNIGQNIINADITIAAKREKDLKKLEGIVRDSVENFPWC